MVYPQTHSLPPQGRSLISCLTVYDREKTIARHMESTYLNFPEDDEDSLLQYRAHGYPKIVAQVQLTFR